MSRHSLLFGLIFWPMLASGAPTLKITCAKSDATFQVGEKITWNVQVVGDAASSFKEASYVLKKAGNSPIGQGDLHFTNGMANIQTSLDEPGTILAEITAPPPAGEQKNIDVFAGAAVSPEKIQRSSPCPDDFDTFWKAKLSELAAIPENPILTKEDSGVGNVDYWKITFDNIRGTHIEGQLSRPVGNARCPAMVIFQYAGVYPLEKKWVTDDAAQGWMVLNINAHDLPIDRPADFYTKLAAGPLAGYTSINNDDRERSYFLRMFLACARAVDYLSERPDWNGKSLIVTGASQGGLQSIVAAALNPKVTDVLVLVPAGCDNTGELVGRKAGWPFWLDCATGKDPQKVLNTSRYFDAVNFAARIKCPILAGLGLIDQTAPPSGVFAALNQIQDPKEVVVMPDADHTGTGNTHAPFWDRCAAWKSALVNGNPPPVGH
jgi:cephalosporin-C deacetylase